MPGRHQNKALSMMFEKESGKMHDNVFPAVWVDISDAAAGNRETR